MKNTERMTRYNMIDILDHKRIAYICDYVDRKNRIIICGNTTESGNHYAIMVYFDDDDCYYHHGHCPLTWEKYGGNNEIAKNKLMIEACNDFNHFGNFEKYTVRELFEEISHTTEYK